MQKLVSILIYLICILALQAQTNDINSRSPLLIYRDIERSIDAKDFSQAHNLATEIIETTPSFKEAYRARAYANFELRNYQDAESDIRKFHELLKHDRYDIFVLLARIQIAQTNYQDAVTSFEKVRELKPSTPNIYLSLAKLYYQQGNYNMAKTRLQEAVRLEPPHLQQTAEKLLKETQKQITRKSTSSTYLIQAEKELRAGNIPAALRKLDQWSTNITSRAELTEIKKNEIFKVLYNRAQYQNMIKDINTRFPDKDKK